ncbi:MAG: hypothetical protein EPN97_09050 [Alphaproteobacteria bacterium]|nr:MAG: hypothetical protein EPN97_09050 [Alphaproteobacteria bacterium]
MGTESKYLRSFKPGWGSMLRMALWCLLFLWAFGRLVPPLPERIPLSKNAGPHTVPMLTIFDDPRTVREDYRPDPNKLHIAWVSDSSGVLIPEVQKLSEIGTDDYHTIPDAVATALGKRHPMPDFDIPLYLRLGSRPVDTLVFALRALRDKPDLIVIPFNQVWSFSHYQIMNKTTSLNVAPSLWAGVPSLWSMIPVFCSPAENLWALLGDRLDIIRYALPFKDYLEERHSGLLKALGIYAGPAPIVLGVPLLNIKFWIVMNILRGDPAQLLDSTGNLNPELYYAQIISHSSPSDDDSFALISFYSLLNALKASGIPVLIYDHPLSDAFHNSPETSRKIKEVQAFLDKTSESLKGSRIRIISRIPESVRKSIRFRKNDGYHAVVHSAKFEDFLADQIWLMLKDSGKVPPTKGRKTP